MSVVTPAEIKLLPLRYAIGKRPLSILLGWGELTYTRLIDGNNPTPAHAMELRRLLDDPAAFAHLLQTRRKRITDAAFNRSMTTIDELLQEEGGADRATRIFAVADRLCILANGDLTPSGLQRLVYYAQGVSLAKGGSPLFDDLPTAGITGPEYSRIALGYAADDIMRAWERFNAEPDDEKTRGEEALTERDIKAIDAAYKLYGDYSGQALSRMSRQETPWRKARKRAGAKDNDACEELISIKSMKKFFSKNL